MKLHVVRIAGAPLFLTEDPTEYLANGSAVAAYELDATQTYPEPEPPLEEPQPPEEAT